MLEPSWNSSWDPSPTHESEGFAYSDFGPPSMESGGSSEHYAFDFSATSGDSPYYGLEYTHGSPGTACDDPAAPIPSFHGPANVSIVPIVGIGIIPFPPGHSYP
jgi:hypothetical protein